MSSAILDYNFKKEKLELNELLSRFLRNFINYRFRADVNKTICTPQITGGAEKLLELFIMS